MKADEQKAALLAKGWTEAELKANNWQARDWGEQDFRDHIELMSNGTRDLLRCPMCKSVGTFKPRYNPVHEDNARYYVCKWCGYGRDQFGVWQYRPDKKHKVWGMVNENSGPTPQEIMAQHNLDPFCG